MPNPFASKLTPVNPLPENAKISDVLPADGKMRMEQGTAVYDRADPASFDRSRRGLTQNVNDGPDIAYDEFT